MAGSAAAETDRPNRLTGNVYKQLCVGQTGDRTRRKQTGQHLVDISADLDDARG